MSGGANKIRIPEKDLRQWYAVELRSYRWIMEKTGCRAARGIRRLLTEYGIPIRRGSEAVATQWIDAKTRRKETSKRAKKSLAPYWGTQSKRPEVAAKISASKRGSKNPMFGVTGSNHPNWIGGKDSWSSKRKMPPQHRRNAFETLGRVCVRCGSTKSLTLNHKIPWRECRHHELWNLEVLCASCHFCGPIRSR